MTNDTIVVRGVKVWRVSNEKGCATFFGHPTPFIGVHTIATDLHREMAKDDEMPIAIEACVFLDGREAYCDSNTTVAMRWADESLTDQEIFERLKGWVP